MCKYIFIWFLTVTFSKINHVFDDIHKKIPQYMLRLCKWISDLIYRFGRIQKWYIKALITNTTLIIRFIKHAWRLTKTWLAFDCLLMRNFKRFKWRIRGAHRADITSWKFDESSLLTGSVSWSFQHHISRQHHFTILESKSSFARLLFVIIQRTW